MQGVQFEENNQCRRNGTKLSLCPEDFSVGKVDSSYTPDAGDSFLKLLTSSHYKILFMTIQEILSELAPNITLYFNYCQSCAVQSESGIEQWQ